MISIYRDKLQRCDEWRSTRQAPLCAQTSVKGPVWGFLLKLWITVIVWPTHLCLNTAINLITLITAQLYNLLFHKFQNLSEGVTRVVGQCLGGSVFTWGDQVPDEALDILVTTIMQQAVGQKGSADCFHIGFLQGTLEATVSQDITPPTPTKDRHGGEKKGKGRLGQPLTYNIQHTTFV